MRSSLYLIGGAGAGKSTFMLDLLVQVGALFSPMVDLYHGYNSKGHLVPLRGHPVQVGPRSGVYLGPLRPYHPGTDGLKRECTVAGPAWLDTVQAAAQGGEAVFGEGTVQPQMDFILAEGATLATRPFLEALHQHTRLRVVHLLPPGEEELARRFRVRGSTQKPTFVRNTISRSRNLAAHMVAAGAVVDEVPAEDDVARRCALRMASQHLWY